MSCRNVRIESDEDQEAFDMSLSNGNKFFKGKSFEVFFNFVQRILILFEY